MEAVKGYGDFMKNTISENTAEAAKHWMAKQTYIALGNLLTACAVLKIDACPMEGFDAEAYDEILGLDAKNLTTAVLATVGYRAEDDATQHAAKVRKPKSELFETL